MPSRRALALIFFCLATGVVQGACRRKSGGPPGPELLPVIEQLPDPFRLKDGRRIAGATDWPERRTEITDLLQSYAYGHLPPAPGAAPPIRAEEIERSVVHGGRGLQRQVRLSFGPEGAISMVAGIIQAASGKGPFPVILHIDHRMTFGISLAEEMVKRGYLVVGFHPNLLDPDEPGITGPAQAAYPDRDWGTLAVWAWGAMRVVDYLITLPEVDRQRIVVTGHSRSGKAALLAGALDERFALVAPQGSGCAGAASYRFRGPGSETLADVTRNFPYWFVPGLAAFAGKENRLPFDQHFLLALVAPRALLTIDAEGDAWANPFGTQASHQGARPVFEMLGAGNRLGLFLRPGQHELTDEDWRALLDFADEKLRGKPAARRFDRLPFPERRLTQGWRAPGR